MLATTNSSDSGESPRRRADAKYTIAPSQLFNLSQDLGETTNLAEEMPEKTRELQRQLVDYLQAVDSEVLKLAR